MREREWEAAHTVWIWFDRSASMRFGSNLAPGDQDRPRRGARARVRRPLRSRRRARRAARAHAADREARRDRALRRGDRDGRAAAWPSERAAAAGAARAARSMALLIGDFLCEPERDRAGAPRDQRRGRDRRAGDRRRSDRGDLSVLRQRGVPRIRTGPSARAPQGAEHPRGLSRAAGGASRGAAAACAQALGWGMSLHRTDVSGGGDAARVAHASCRPRAGVAQLGRLTMFGIAARFRRACRPGRARSARRCSISSCG